MEEKTDALGQPLELGEVYGYSKRSNGHVRVVVGELVRINEKRVTLNVLEKRSAVYDNNTTENTNAHKNSHVTANSIFKLDNYEKQ